MLPVFYPIIVPGIGIFRSFRSGKIVRKLRNTGFRIVTAESLTGGLIASSIACVPGVSDVLWGGFITYNEEAKRTVLGVPVSTIEQFGVVSKETALSMAEGALKLSGAELAVAVTGVAGPGRNQGDPPVGTVIIAVMSALTFPVPIRKTVELSLAGSRNTIRSATVLAAFRLIDDCLDRQ